MRAVLLDCLFPLCLLTQLASEPSFPASASFPRVPPKTPTEEAQTFQIQHGFRVELVASEPLICSPVDVAYDEQGRAYVVEMRGYPLPEKPDDPRPDPASRVSQLVDSDGDGRYDRSTVFVAGLHWPTAVCCWRGGVFIADAPDIWYARDIDNDGRADELRRVFTGFGHANVQALVNNLRLGADGWIYGAASGNGGTIRVVSRPDHPLVSVARRDFRFHPDRLDFEAVSGGARFGHSFDNFGQRFLCNIRNPVQHVVLPLRYLERLRIRKMPPVLHDVAESGETLPVYRISPPEAWREYRARRWVAEGQAVPRSELVAAGFFTSSSGITIYRGGMYPEAFRGNAFVADVAANVVHRQIISPAGVTFRGERGEQKCEFLASTDNWFRPVNFVNAPDGCLHIVDMYREYIEHPWSIPDDIRAQLDLTSGKDRGRIWRLLPPPEQTDPFPPRPALHVLTPPELVDLLNSPHAWWRETAQRLLLERQPLEVVPELRRLAQAASAVVTRWLALWTLATWSQLSREDVQRAAADPHPRLRELAVLLAELCGRDTAWGKAVALAAIHDDDPRVRFQAALSLGTWSDEAIAAALVSLAQQDVEDYWMRMAILTSCSGLGVQVLHQWRDRVASRHSPPNSPAVLEWLSAVAESTAVRDDASARAAWPVCLHWPQPDERYALLSGWLRGLHQRGQSLETLLGVETAATFHQQVQQFVLASDTSPRARALAIPCLPPHSWKQFTHVITDWLSPQQPPEVLQATIEWLARTDDPQAAGWLIEHYRQFSPSMRTQVIDLLTGRRSWQLLLLHAVEQQQIPVTDVSATRRTLLLRTLPAEYREHAERLLQKTTESSRREVIQRHQSALQLVGDAQRGRETFRRECAQCHRLHGEGVDVGPPLSSVRHRTPEELLTHVLDPNREVAPNYTDYTVVLRDGRILNGLLAEESSHQIVLLRPQGQREAIPRETIEEVSSTGRSLMPEGLELRMTMQELADLLAFLRQ